MLLHPLGSIVSLVQQRQSSKKMVRVGSDRYQQLPWGPKHMTELWASQHLVSPMRTRLRKLSLFCADTDSSGMSLLFVALLSRRGPCVADPGR